MPRTLDSETDPDVVRDRLHPKMLLLSRAVRGGCWEWLGTRQKGKGKIGVLCVLGRQRPAARVAAWVYLGGFDINDSHVVVQHRRGCRADCVNYQHLTVRRKGEPSA